MKKVLTTVASFALAVTLAACSGSSSVTPAASVVQDGSTGSVSSSSVGSEAGGTISGKIGVILVGDENEGYTAAHMEGIATAAKALGIPDNQIIWKYNIGETQDCEDAAVDLVDQGATLVVSNSYGHQTFMETVASNNPDVTFIAMTGDGAATSGLSNFKNAFNQTYQSRYVSGVVAGMKLAELVADGTVSKEATPDAYVGDDIKIGYVGAFPYAEVVSGYTAFYLGVKSVVENVHMFVEYTNSWADLTKEAETANSLIAKGCVIISQHADTTGAPSAIQSAFESGKVVYSVGYNVSMLSVAPDAALTSASNDWSVYYTYAFSKWLDGNSLGIATDWSEGYDTGAVCITELGKSVAEGTEEKVAEVEDAIKSGTLNVFDSAAFTVGGEMIDDELMVDLDFDGNGDIKPVEDGIFYESNTKAGFRSAPYFSLRIDGIEEAGV